MATAQDLVTRAIRRLQAIDMNEQPSAAEMSHGLDVLSELINAWSMDIPAIAVRTMSADLTISDATVTLVDDTTTGLVEDAQLLADGLNVSGTGVPTGAYIKEITNKTQFELSAVATATGSSVVLTFSPIPFPVRHESGVVALLAVRLAGDFGLPDAPARVVEDAKNGWNALLADYITIPDAVYDAAVVQRPTETVLSLFGD